ncbi:structural cement protein Gp24 [Consotaella aegiceratis]|uniref:structural cement protein Gp24 n=1 Tax=Consotaella aegiceratis TaxID=3097961 RepID=UPI002F40585A
MAPYQTTYSAAPAKGLPGQISSEEKCNEVSRTVETAAGIKFGAPAQRGSGDHGAAILSTGDFLGIAVLHPAVPANDSNPDAYPQYFTGAFMTMGTIFVTADATVAAGDPVYYVTGTGRYTNTDNSSANPVIPDAFFEEAGADGGVVEISLGLRHQA